MEDGGNVGDSGTVVDGGTMPSTSYTVDPLHPPIYMSILIIS